MTAAVYIQYILYIFVFILFEEVEFNTIYNMTHNVNKHFLIYFLLSLHNVLLT